MKQDEEKRKKENINYTIYTSDKLGFSISLPSNWTVNVDELGNAFLNLPMTQEISAEEAYKKHLKEYRDSALRFNEFKKIYKKDKKEAYKAFFETCLGSPEDQTIEEKYANKRLSAAEAYKELMNDPETFMISFDEFKEIHENDQKIIKEQERKRKEISQMGEGFFRATSPDDENYPSVEVTRLKLTRSMSAMELYQLDKPHAEEIPWGNRPQRGIKVDGLQGIKFYFVTGFNIDEMFKFMNVYLVEEQTGWIISCACFFEAFQKYKENFTKIVKSFSQS